MALYPAEDIPLPKFHPSLATPPCISNPRADNIRSGSQKYSNWPPLV